MAIRTVKSDWKMLDYVSTQPMYSYALRKINSKYTGQCIRLRRSGDNAEQDIGFNSNGIDTSSLQSFCGENLAKQSETFDNATWLKSLLVVQPNVATDPNLTSNADSITPNNGLVNCALYATSITAFTSGSTYYLSVYVKSGPLNKPWVELTTVIPGDSTRRVWFNTNTGTVGSSLGGALSPTMQSVGNGWYRISYGVTPAVSASVTAYISPRDSDNYVSGVTGNGTDASHYVWGFQINTASVKQYTATTATALDGNGFVTKWYDQGRYWNAGRYNLFTYTEQLSTSPWVVNQATMLLNTPAPDGTSTADVMTENAVATTQHRLSLPNVTVPSGQKYTLSVYVKRGTGTRNFQLGIMGGLGAKAFFNLTTLTTFGLVNADSASIVAADNGFYRVSLTATTTSTSASLFLAIVTTKETYSGDGTSSIVIWGAQFQTGELTDYQPIYAGTPLDVVQATTANQPQIVENGNVITESGRPSIRFGSSAFLQVSGSDFVQPFTRAFVATRKDTAILDGNAHYVNSFNVVPNTMDYCPNAANFAMYAGVVDVAIATSFSLNETAIWTSMYDTTASKLFKNATSKSGSVGAQSGSGVRIGVNTPGSGTTFGISELFLFNLSLGDTEIVAIQRNQGNYYGITI